MLYLQFKINDQSFVMATESVVTLIPVVEIEFTPDKPEYIPGVINYKGDTVPVIDIAKKRMPVMLSSGQFCI